LWLEFDVRLLLTKAALPCLGFFAEGLIDEFFLTIAPQRRQKAGGKRPGAPRVWSPAAEAPWPISSLKQAVILYLRHASRRPA
jgi:hypothetical protein